MEGTAIDGLIDAGRAGVLDLWATGGPVMPWLLLCAAILWYALGFRWMTLRRGDSRPLRVLLAATDVPRRGIVSATVAEALDRMDSHAHLDSTQLSELLGHPRAELRRGQVLVRTMVAVAPLAGLLGTVGGMIETFKSLAEMALYTQGGGIAGGIAQALLTTQVGLAVAVPGIVIGRALDRRQQRLGDELDMLEELMHGPGAAELTGRAA